MSKRLEKIQKEIKAIEDSRKAFIAKFENGLKEVDAEIAQREENLENALAANDFEAYETESDKLAFLREKKQHLEIGLQNAETTGIGDYTKTRQEIFEAVTEAVEPKVKEIFTHAEALKGIAKEIEAQRNAAESLLWSIKEWTDFPQNSLGLDYSSGLLRWALAASNDWMYEQTARKHPEWQKVK